MKPRADLAALARRVFDYTAILDAQQRIPELRMRMSRAEEVYEAVSGTRFDWPGKLKEMEEASYRAKSEVRQKWEAEGLCTRCGGHLYEAGHGTNSYGGEYCFIKCAVCGEHDGDAVKPGELARRRGEDSRSDSDDGNGLGGLLRSFFGW